MLYPRPAIALRPWIRGAVFTLERPAVVLETRHPARPSTVRDGSFLPGLGAQDDLIYGVVEIGDVPAGAENDAGPAAARRGRGAMVVIMAERADGRRTAMLHPAPRGACSTDSTGSPDTRRS